jgi:hypothetical protein
LVQLERPSPKFQEQQRFLKFARALVRLPGPGDGPLDYLLPEADWQELCSRMEDRDSWFMGLSQATGVYFFPSREWPWRFIRYLQRLEVKRLLEAGAGRGYLTGALASLAAARGLTFRAVDRGEGEFISELPVHPLVEGGDVFQAAGEFQPEAIIYAWPPPGQSLAGLFNTPSVRYLFVAGERGGGVTGAREDWEMLPHKISSRLTRFSRGRTGTERHCVTIFSRIVPKFQVPG